MRGRKPKPTHLRVIEGNPGKRPINKKEAKPRATIPAAPAHLSAVAKAEWKRISPELHKLGLLTRIDRAALAAYCTAWGRWVDAEKMLREHGVLVKTKKTGFPMQSPYLAIANKAMDQMTRLLTEFGMSPSSRSRISVTDAAPADASDPWAKKR